MVESWRARRCCLGSASGASLQVTLLRNSPMIVQACDMHIMTLFIAILTFQATILR